MSEPRFIILSAQERRRASLERKVAYWERRVKENPKLQPQLEHAEAQLSRLNEKYDSPGKE